MIRPYLPPSNRTWCMGSFYAFGHMLTFGAIEYLKIDLPGKLPLCELVTPPEYLVPEDYCANKHIINALSEFIQVRESSSQYISCLENDPFADTYSFLFSLGNQKVDEFTMLSYLHASHQYFNASVPTLFNNNSFNQLQKDHFFAKYNLDEYKYFVVHFRDGGFKNEQKGKDPLRSIGMKQAEAVVTKLLEYNIPLVLLGEGRSIKRFKDKKNVIILEDIANEQFIATKFAYAAILNASGIMNRGQIMGTPSLPQLMPTIPYYSPWVLEVPKQIATKNGRTLSTEDICNLI